MAISQQTASNVSPSERVISSHWQHELSLKPMADVISFLEALLPLSLTILIAGGLGGIAAFLTTSKTASTQVRFGITGFAMVGITAAFTVPLFLSLLQSNILSEVKSGENSEAYLIFGGFCILAGFSAKAFLSTLSDRVINELTNKMADGQERAEVQIQELKDNLAYQLQMKETATADQNSPLSPKLSQTGRSLSDLEKTVLSALGDLAVRTIDGISQDSAITNNQTEDAVVKLIDRKLATHRSPFGTGRRLVSLTEDGLELAARLATGGIL
ncbi:YEATS-associated helix-containing protein [Roseibium alexandrii]|nr:YEATS-associated helix-containing protein [Roseibium alexandrii]